MMNTFKNAKWIWENDKDNINEYINFINFFTIDNDYELVLLKISIDTNYELYLNGKQISFGQYPDYPFYKVYDEIDITSYIQKGLNTLAILGYYQGIDSSTYYKNKPGLIFEISNENDTITCSSENTLCRKANDYQSGDVELITGQIGFSYNYHASKYDGWIENSYSTSGDWHNAVLVDFIDEFYQRPIKKLETDENVIGFIASQGVFINTKSDETDNTTAYKMQHAFMAYRSLYSIARAYPKAYLPCNSGYCFSSNEGDGIYIVVDLEKESAGGFVIDIDAPDGTLIEVSYGEHLDDLRVRSYIGGRNFAFTYKCKEGRNVFKNYLRRLGCRFLQLNIHAKNFTLYNASIIGQYYPVSVKDIIITDPLQRRIYNTCVETLKLCMHEHYEDTPWREQSLYSMDSRNQMLCGYYAFEEYDFAKASLWLMLIGRREDEHLNLCSPAKHPLSIPCFTLVWFLQLYEYAIYSKDLDFVMKAYQQSSAILNVFLDKLQENGLILELEESGFWNFYEWTEGLDGYCLPDGKRYSAILNSFLSIAIVSYAKVAELLGLKDDAIKYMALHSAINKAIDDCFWDENNQAYASFSDERKIYHFAELTQALVIYAGACPKHKADKVLEKLIHEHSGLNSISISHSIFKYDVLLQYEFEKYASYVTEDIKKIWGEMLYNKATSFWETQNGGWEFSNAGSLCHGWSAVPLYIYCKYKLY